jgi:hypothetical protein
VKTKEEVKKEKRNSLIRIVLLVVGLLVILTGCTSKTEFGDCIGLADDKEPDLIYKVSAWNVFVAVVGIEMIAPPILVAVDETFCPVGRKDDKPAVSAQPFPGS